MILFLTSSPVGVYRSNAPLDYRGFNPANGLAEKLRHFWPDCARCLLIAADPEAYGMNDRMRQDFAGIAADTGLSLACMDLLDGRNARQMVSVLPGYDFVLLGGGHVPTQNAFFHRIGLPEQLRRFHGIVMGISAGTMNCAETVYAQPELPGEAADTAYRRFLPGLGLTKHQILPHYQAVKHDRVDGLRLMEDITLPDSYGHTFYALPDGSYLLQVHGRGEIRGEAYRIQEGGITQICADGEICHLGGP